MKAKGITPILNVSDISASFAWFEIFLCQGGQGGRGRGANASTFGPGGDQTADKGAWMSVWVDDVDVVHGQCVGAGPDVTFTPTDMPWNVREMHLRTLTGMYFASAEALSAWRRSEARQ